MSDDTFNFDVKSIKVIADTIRQVNKWRADTRVGVAVRDPYGDIADSIMWGKVQSHDTCYNYVSIKPCKQDGTLISDRIVKVWMKSVEGDSSSKAGLAGVILDNDIIRWQFVRVDGDGNMEGQIVNTMPELKVGTHPYSGDDTITTEDTGFLLFHDSDFTTGSDTAHGTTCQGKALVGWKGFTVWPCTHTTENGNHYTAKILYDDGGWFTWTDAGGGVLKFDLNLHAGNATTVTQIDRYDCTKGYKIDWTGFTLQTGCGAGNVIGGLGASSSQPLMLGPGIDYGPVAGLTGYYLHANLTSNMPCVSWQDVGCAKQLTFPSGYDCQTLTVMSGNPTIVTVDNVDYLHIPTKTIHFIGKIENGDDIVMQLSACPDPS
jgi:hypothetical protein